MSMAASQSPLARLNGDFWAALSPPTTGSVRAALRLSVTFLILYSNKLNTMC